MTTPLIGLSGCLYEELPQSAAMTLNSLGCADPASQLFAARCVLTIKLEMQSHNTADGASHFYVSDGNMSRNPPA
jgi:hypothetical protein